MAKEWKKIKDSYSNIDTDSRDSATLLYKNTIYVGKKFQSHAMLVCMVLYGMETSFEISRDNEWTIDGLYLKDGIPYTREEVDVDDSEILYGHLIGDNIFWDTLCLEDHEKISNYLKTSKDSYNHFVSYKMYSDYRKIV